MLVIYFFFSFHLLLQETHVSDDALILLMYRFTSKPF